MTNDQFPSHPSGYPDINGEVIRLRERRAAVSRIVRRTLACGQLEKLEDDDDEPEPITHWMPLPEPPKASET